jgi:hypothetical protein
MTAGFQIFLLFTQFFWNKTQNPTFSCKFLMFLADIFLIIESSEKISYSIGVFQSRWESCSKAFTQ